MINKSLGLVRMIFPNKVSIIKADKNRLTKRKRQKQVQILY